jgi:hypothetical protein
VRYLDGVWCVVFGSQQFIFSNDSSSLRWRERMTGQSGSPKPPCSQKC